MYLFNPKPTKNYQRKVSFNFSKIEQTFEFHRYNLGSCRVFIQNYTSNELIIHITIYDLETNSVYEKYEEIKTETIEEDSGWKFLWFRSRSESSNKRTKKERNQLEVFLLKF